MPPKKEEKKKDQFVEVGFVLLVLGIIVLLWSYILQAIYPGNAWAAFIVWFITHVWPFIIILSVLIIILSLMGITYNIRRINEIAKEEAKIYGPKAEMTPVAREIEKNGRWEKVVAHLNSPNSAEWRLAIIEADVMLDEMLRAQGYDGDTIGEMLKGITHSDMTTLDDAWEAHKIRNQIAHQGSDYLLNEREVKRVIALYEKVFKEFHVI